MDVLDRETAARSGPVGELQLLAALIRRLGGDVVLSDAELAGVPAIEAFLTGDGFRVRVS